MRLLRAADLHQKVVRRGPADVPPEHEMRVGSGLPDHCIGDSPSIGRFRVNERARTRLQTAVAQEPEQLTPLKLGQDHYDH
jgi:hypothetical protein